MIQLAATIPEHLLEIRRRLVQVFGQLHRADRPLPRLTYEQDLLITAAEQLIAALYDRLALRDTYFVSTPKAGAEKVILDDLPMLPVVTRTLIPGEPEPPFAAEIATVIHEDSVNALLSTGLWELRQTVAITGFLLARKQPEVKSP